MADKIVISQIEFLQGLVVYFHKNIDVQGGWTQNANKDILNDLRELLAIIADKGFGQKDTVVTITKKGNKLILELSS